MQHGRDRADISADDRVVYPISVIASALYVLHQNITLPVPCKPPVFVAVSQFSRARKYSVSYHGVGKFSDFRPVTRVITCNDESAYQS